MFSFGLPCEVVVMVWQRYFEDWAEMEFASGRGCGVNLNVLKPETWTSWMWFMRSSWSPQEHWRLLPNRSFVRFFQGRALIFSRAYFHLVPWRSPVEKWYWPSAYLMQRSLQRESGLPALSANKKVKIKQSSVNQKVLWEVVCFKSFFCLILVTNKTRLMQVHTISLWQVKHFCTI